MHSHGYVHAEVFFIKRWTKALPSRSWRILMICWCNTAFIGRASSGLINILTALLCSWRVVAPSLKDMKPPGRLYLRTYFIPRKSGRYMIILVFSNTSVPINLRMRFLPCSSLRCISRGKRTKFSRVSEPCNHNGMIW